LQILKDLGLSAVRLLTNNPQKINAFPGFDLTVVEQVPIIAPPEKQREFYLATKRDKLGTSPSWWKRYRKTSLRIPVSAEENITRTNHERSPMTGLGGRIGGDLITDLDRVDAPDDFVRYSDAKSVSPTVNAGRLLMKTVIFEGGVGIPPGPPTCGTFVDASIFLQT